MCLDSQSSSMHRDTTHVPVVRLLTLLLLVLSVPFLTTLAKTHWYLPQSDPGHYLTIASKAKVAHPQIVFDRPLLDDAIRLFQPELQVQRVAWQDLEPAIPPISLTFSPQFRSPPAQA